MQPNRKISNIGHKDLDKTKLKKPLETLGCSKKTLVRNTLGSVGYSLQLHTKNSSRSFSLSLVKVVIGTAGHPMSRRLRVPLVDLDHCPAQVQTSGGTFSDTTQPRICGILSLEVWPIVYLVVASALVLYLHVTLLLLRLDTIVDFS